MPLFALPHGTCIWARDKLEKSGRKVEHVERVFPPRDTGDEVEVLYLDADGPMMAHLDAAGEVLRIFHGW
jgi:hypothetical protein